MRTRTLLIEPPYGEPKMEPNGLLYLATWARQHGFETDVLYESPKTRRSVAQLVEAALAGDYDIVGVNAMTPTLPRALAILRAIKHERPGVRGLLGGYHATVAHDKLLARHPEVDIAVRGEGEHTFVELLGRIAAGRSLEGVTGLSFRAGGQIVVNELRPVMKDLDILPFPNRDLGPGPEEYVHFYDRELGRALIRANVTSSRGCPYGCAFCVLGSDDPGSPISLRKWRGRSPANVVDEIEQLIQERGVGCIQFAEDNFTVSPRRLDEFADLVLERELRFAFTCDSRANQICRLEWVIPKLRRAGLRKVEIGIESGSPRVLERFAKGTKVEDNIRALEILRENDIVPRIDFLMFDMETTVEDLELNLAFLKQHAPSNYDHGRTVYQKIELHPGTELQRSYLASGRVSGETDEVVQYDFERSEVERVFRVMDRFYWDQQIRLDELNKRCHFLQVRLGERQERERLARLVQDLVFIVLPINALPLRLFDSVMRAGRDSGFDAASMARARRPFEDRVSALESEFEDVVKKHDLAVHAIESYSGAAR